MNFQVTTNSKFLMAFETEEEANKFREQCEANKYREQCEEFFVRPINDFPDPFMDWDSYATD